MTEMASEGVPLSDDGLSDSILDGLPPNTKQYPYTNIQDFLSIISGQTHCLLQSPVSCSQFVVFCNISPDKYTNDFDEGTSRVVDSYYPQHQTLVVKMPTKAHEDVFRSFDNALTGKLFEMGRANYGLHKTGAGKVATPGRAKQPDEEYLPIRLPRGRSSKWPSMVIESGYTDTRRTLKNNAQWWLNESAGDVKAVITTCVSKNKPEIVFDLWVSSGNNTNIIMTQQSATVTKATANATARVSGGPFTVAFEDLFLRPADGPEGDLIFDDQDLAWVSESTWDIQFPSH